MVLCEHGPHQPSAQEEKCQEQEGGGRAASDPTLGSV